MVQGEDVTVYSLHARGAGSFFGRTAIRYSVAPLTVFQTTVNLLSATLATTPPGAAGAPKDTPPTPGAKTGESRTMTRPNPAGGGRKRRFTALLVQRDAATPPRGFFGIMPSFPVALLAQVTSGPGGPERFAAGRQPPCGGRERLAAGAKTP